MDWNNDGMKDLITGERNGTIRIYLNVNSDEDPVFNGYTFLQKSGANFDCGYTSVPYIADWNNDGKKDMLCGEDGGKLILMINVGTDAAPVFNSQSFIKDGSVDLDVGSRNSPMVVDWNRDVRKDLIIGDTYGNLKYFENKGTDAAPVFNGYTSMTANGQVIDVNYYSRPDWSDWNGDGVADIICGNYETTPTATAFVLFFESVGPLSLGTNWITESGGGKIQLHLDAGPANAGRDYLVLGSVSGTEPGTPLPGGQATLPINWDFFTSTMIGLLNTTVFDHFMGALDPSGKASARFEIGPVPGSAGYCIYFAYGLNDPWNYASNGAAVEVIP